MESAISQNPIVEAIPQLDANIPAEQFITASPWPTILIVSGGLLLLGILIYLWYQRRKKQHAPLPPSPLALSMARLDTLEQNIPSMRDCSIELSLIIREFLAGQTQDTSLFETHEEFTQRIDSLTTLPHACRLDTQELLNTLAEHKYTPESADDIAHERELISHTRQLLQGIVDAQKKEAELAKQQSAKSA